MNNLPDHSCKILQDLYTTAASYKILQELNFMCKNVVNISLQFITLAGTCKNVQDLTSSCRMVSTGSTYIDSRQKSTEISYWAYGYTGNCIIRVTIVLYFQLTLYIAGIATRIVRSQLLRRYIQPEPICQPSGRAL